MAKDNPWQRIRKRGPLPVLPFEALVSLWRFTRRLGSQYRLKSYGAKIERQCHIGIGLKVVHPQNIHIGNNVTIGDRVRFWSETPDGSMEVGDDCEIGRNSLLDFSGKLFIEEGALLSEDVIVYTHTHGYNPKSVPIASPLIIGRKAWIGARAIILPSVNRIGEGAVIGAGSVVSADVPDDHLYVGAPGRTLEKKQSAET